jgi:hypothetical protein
MVVPPGPIELALDDKQLNCLTCQELSIGMLKEQKIKCLIFWVMWLYRPKKKVTASLGKGRDSTLLDELYRLVQKFSRFKAT